MPDQHERSWAHHGGGTNGLPIVRRGARVTRSDREEGERCDEMAGRPGDDEEMPDRMGPTVPLAEQATQGPDGIGQTAGDDPGHNCSNDPQASAPKPAYCQGTPAE
jgi:hypothetical protein